MSIKIFNTHSRTHTDVLINTKNDDGGVHPNPQDVHNEGQEEEGSSGDQLYELLGGGCWRHRIIINNYLVQFIDNCLLHRVADLSLIASLQQNPQCQILVREGTMTMTAENYCHRRRRRRCRH
jgi:hypothetical protein